MATKKAAMLLIIPSEVTQSTTREAMSALLHSEVTYISKESLAAERQGNLPAYELAEIYLRQIRALSGDNNFAGQAISRLASGELGIQEEVEVSDEECSELLEAGRERLTQLTEIPGYTLDGIHCSGKDRRFAGIGSDMAAACDEEWYASATRWLKMNMTACSPMKPSRAKHRFIALLQLCRLSPATEREAGCESNGAPLLYAIVHTKRNSADMVIWPYRMA